jgi:hypothetical protein
VGLEDHNFNVQIGLPLPRMQSGIDTDVLNGRQL